MKKQKGSNRPGKGAAIKVDPIRGEDSIQKIRLLLKDQPRNLCLFNMGINTGCRAGELLSLTIGDMKGLAAGDPLTIKQSKTGKYRTVFLNNICMDALSSWLEVHPDKTATAPLFVSCRPMRRSRFCVFSYLEV